MRIAAVIARILLGVMFFVFGLNGFLQFIPAPPPPGAAGVFVGALFSSHFYVLIFGTQLIAGILLLLNQFVPLALVLLAAVIANILVFHITMQPSGLGPGLLAAILWVILAFRFWSHLAPLFTRRAAEG
ncbi:MAG TPA: hypothetical protein VK604_05550 [Bryobacteraceae bacterium]|nr:hypothetical protein [Bryobacteraceae bacterium]